MSELNIVICDDELIERVLIRKNLEKYLMAARIKAVISEFASPEELLEKAETVRPDILLLDIYMPEVTGIDLARKIRELGMTCQIIFITSSNGFASEAFEVGTLSYLQKPVIYDKFRKVMDMAVRKFDRLRFIEIFMNRETCRIYLSDIIYMETLNRKLIIHAVAEEYTTYMTLSKIMEVLPENEFLQISRFEIIALKNVESLDSKKVIMKGGTELPLSSRYVESALKKYEEYISREPEE